MLIRLHRPAKRCADLLVRGAGFGARRCWLIALALTVASTLLFPARGQSVETLAGGRVTLFGTDFGSQDGNSKSEAQFNGPLGGVVRFEGELLVADRNNGAIRRLDLSRGTTTTIIPNAFLTSRLATPVALTVDTNQNLYVLTQGDGVIRKFDRFDTLYRFPSNIVSGLASPTAFALDRGGSTFYVTTLAGDIIKVVAATGAASPLAIINTGAPYKLKQPRGIAVLDSGLLLVSDTATNALLFIDPANGSVVTKAGSGLPDYRDGAFSLAMFHEPWQLAKAPNGSVLVADRSNQRVRLLTPDELVTTVYGVDPVFWPAEDLTSDPIVLPGWLDGEPGTAEARLPVGVTVDDQGLAYVTEEYYHIVRRVTGAGLAGGGSTLTVLAPGVLDQADFFVVTNWNANLLLLSQVLYTTDASEPTLNTAASFLLQLTNGIGMIPWPDSTKDASQVRIRGFLGGVGSTSVVARLPRERTILAPLVSPLSGFFPQGIDIRVEDPNPPDIFTRRVFFTTNGTEPGPGNTNSLQVIFQTGSTVGFIHWTNATQDLSSLRVKTFIGDLSSATVVGRQIELVPPTLELVAAAEGVDIRVSRLRTEIRVFYTTNAAEPTPTSFEVTNFVDNVGTIHWTNGLEKLTDLRVKAFFGGFSSPTVLAQQVALNPPGADPRSGYYPVGVDILVTDPGFANPSTNLFLPSKIYFTTDGTEPSPTNGDRVVIGANRTGVARWRNTTNDLSRLRVKAFVGAVGSPTLTGLVSSQNEVGVPYGTNDIAGLISPNLPVAAGSTVVLPVVANLQPGVVLRSLEFRVEISPASASNAVVGKVQVLAASEDDFVPMAGASSGPPRTFSKLKAGPKADTVQLLCVYTNDTFLVRDFATVALLGVPIPTNAPLGERYTVKVIAPSGTSDRFGGTVPLVEMPARTLVVTNTGFLVGDAAPFASYNAGVLTNGLPSGGFGNKDLDNSDFNGALQASFNVRVPPQFTDVFDALDCYPTDLPSLPGGDGLIDFYDWQVLLERALRFDTKNWVRYWTNGVRHVFPDTVTLPAALQPGEEISAVTGLRLDPLRPGVTLEAEAVGFAQPGASVTLRVYATPAAGMSVHGLQFRAIVRPEGEAPLPQTPVQFTVTPGLPEPIGVAGLPSNELGCAWSFLLNPLEVNRRTQLGSLRVGIPAAARAGQRYVVSFASVAGGLDLEHRYDVATRSGSVALLAPAVVPVAGAWKVVWDGLPSQRYAVESTTDLAAGVWRTEVEGLIGRGRLLEYTDRQAEPGQKFYRVRPLE